MAEHDVVWDHSGNQYPGFFRLELDRTAEKKKTTTKQSETLLRKEEVVEVNVVHQDDSDNDEELQWNFHASQEEEEYARQIRQLGG
jgi:hypothetical protein